jgi:hypothetical protein
VLGPATNSDGYIPQWSGADSKTLGNGKAAPSGAIVGTTDAQALTNKDLSGAGNTFPTFNQNTSGTAANLSGTPTLPNGTAATTQTAADNSTKLATTAYADTAAAARTGTIASAQTAMPTAEIAANACSASATTATATGAATTDTMVITYASDPTGVTGYGAGTNGGITVRAWPTANTANFKLCNESGSPITPGALSINWRVVR